MPRQPRTFTCSSCGAAFESRRPLPPQYCPACRPKRSPWQFNANPDIRTRALGLTKR